MIDAFIIPQYLYICAQDVSPAARRRLPHSGTFTTLTQ